MAKEATGSLVELKSTGAAGYDLSACRDISLLPGASHYAETVVILKNWIGEISGRSSVESKGIHVVPSIIDHTHNGSPIRVFMINKGVTIATMAKGDRIGQLILAKKRDLAIEIVDYLGETGVFSHGVIKLYPRESGCILSGECIRIISWIEKMEIPAGHYGKIVGSKKARTYGLFVTNGIVESDYRGAIEIIVHNLGLRTFWFFEIYKTWCIICSSV